MRIKSFSRDLRSWTHWGMLIGGAATVMALGVFATRAQGAEQQAPVYRGTASVAVRTAAATQGSVAASLAYAGDVKAATQVAVLPKASGRIERLLVDVGSPVKKGEVIAELEAASLKAQVSQSKANLASAEAKYANMQAGSREEQVTQAAAGRPGPGQGATGGGRRPEGNAG